MEEEAEEAEEVEEEVDEAEEEEEDGYDELKGLPVGPPLLEEGTKVLLDLIHFSIFPILSSRERLTLKEKTETLKRKKSIPSLSLWCHPIHSVSLRCWYCLADCYVHGLSAGSKS